MESQPQPPQYDDPNTPGSTPASEPAPVTKFSPTAQSLEKGQWIVTQTFVFLVQLFDNLGRLFNEYKKPLITVALILAALLALRVGLVALDALNDIPLVEQTLQLVGISYSIWFVIRYLLKPSTRQELSQQIQGFLNR